MTDEQINAAIHTALGNPLGCPRCNDPECAYNSGVNYSGDLNAMREAEKRLDHEQKLDFADRLLLSLCGDNSAADLSEYFDLLHASSRERAEAFLRTLGKWEEGE
jgi:hypothetical protein